MRHYSGCRCWECCAAFVKKEDSEKTRYYRSNTDIVMQDGTTIEAGVRFEIAENRSEVLGFYIRIPNGESYKVHLDWILSKGIVVA